MKTNEELIKALGPLAALYADPQVIEIMVDSPGRVSVERQGKLEDCPVRFESEDAILKLIEALLALDSQAIRPEQTVYDISLPGKSARMLAVLSPTALDGPSLVIRKMIRAEGVTWEKLLEWGSITQEAVDLIKKALSDHVSMLIAGGTASGKTTFMNRVAELIPAQERLVVVEAVHELQIKHPRTIFLEAGGPEGLSYSDVMSIGSMMHPDWLVLGELYTGDALRAVELLSRGHTGITNIHAESPEDALGRLEMLCLKANPALGLAEIRSLVSAALRLVLFQRKLPGAGRKIMEIVEICGVENGRYILQRLFRFNTETSRLEATGVAPSWEGQ
jgi:pilus assembly protein CpaF